MANHPWGKLDLLKLDAPQRDHTKSEYDQNLMLFNQDTRASTFYRLHPF